MARLRRGDGAGLLLRAFRGHPVIVAERELPRSVARLGAAGLVNCPCCACGRSARTLQRNFVEVSGKFGTMSHQERQVAAAAPPSTSNRAESCRALCFRRRRWQRNPKHTDPPAPPSLRTPQRSAAEIISALRRKFLQAHLGPAGSRQPWRRRRAIANPARAEPSRARVAGSGREGGGGIGAGGFDMLSDSEKADEPV